jgi:hypothetical protein
LPAAHGVGLGPGCQTGGLCRCCRGTACSPGTSRAVQRHDSGDQRWALPSTVERPIRRWFCARRRGKALHSIKCWCSSLGCAHSQFWQAAAMLPQMTRICPPDHSAFHNNLHDNLHCKRRHIASLTGFGSCCSRPANSPLLRAIPAPAKIHAVVVRE